ncbi:MAG: AAA family ATPase [Bacteroidales bacterium]|nr:AAA family ATPase [Bacteroidales bacterium]
MIIDKISVRNFKRLEFIEFELKSPLVLIGPNNSGKTSLLQAITLLETGLRRIAAEKKSGTVRTGIPINRKDLISIPVPQARLLWYKKNVRSQKTGNILIEIIAEGTIGSVRWHAALEFDYANEEWFYCRALRMDEKGEKRHTIDKAAYEIKVAYLQPMSGLASTEDRLTPGSIDRKIGEGKTADVIRNICYQLLHPEKSTDALPDSEIKRRWDELNRMLTARFGIKINEPVFNPGNGLLDMTYTEHGIEYDLSNAGRGFQQTLLLLGFLYGNPGKVILMDEPDAHLEVLRQKEIYNLISDVTRRMNSQLIVASHSEVVLDAAASSDQVIAIIENKAIELNDRQKLREAKKALTDIGWHKYYLARLKKHCVYLEGATDQRILAAFAKLLHHDCKDLLDDAFIDPVEGNIPAEAYKRFKSLKIVEPELKGLAIFDRLDRPVDPDAPLKVIQWNYREIENYFCTPVVFIRWAESRTGSLFTQNYPVIMKEVIHDVFPKLYLENPDDQWWKHEKMSEWADRIFEEFSRRTGQPSDMRKGNFHELIAFLEPDEVTPEITEKLDALLEVIRP